MQNNYLKFILKHVLLLLFTPFPVSPKWKMLIVAPLPPKGKAGKGVKTSIKIFFKSDSRYSFYKPIQFHLIRKQ